MRNADIHSRVQELACENEDERKTTIPTKLIDPNPWRDFELYPIDDAQVEALKNSVESTGGLWLGLMVRKHPTKDGRYQLAFGHHRLAAVKLSGEKEVAVDVQKLTDDDMLKILTTENSTQKADNAAACIDAVASIVKRIAKLLISKDGDKTFGTIVSNVAYEHVKGNFENGKGIGHSTILAYAPEGSLDQRGVQTAIGVLKSSGRYDALIASARAEVEKAEGKPKQLKGADVPAVVSAPTKPVTFDARVAKVFKNDHQLDTFRKAVTEDRALRHVPVERQVELAELITDTAKKSGHELTGARIREAVSNVLLTGEGIVRTMSKEDKQATLAGQIPDELEKLRSANYAFTAGGQKLLSLAAKGAVMTDNQIAKFQTYAKSISDMAEQLTKAFC